MRIRAVLSVVGLAAMSAVPENVDAQQAGAGAERGDRRRGPPAGFEMANSPELADAINALLADEGAHMRMAPRRKATPADLFRAKQIVSTARDALGKYRDVRVAEADGYEKFLPWIETQSIFHYNSEQNAGLTMRRFDAARPVSLLYRKDAKGEMVLVGAMYFALPDATIDDLDARLPTSIAHWHEHVDFCAPRPQDVRDGKVKIDGASTARWLKITTRAACDAAGGRFIPRIFGWMAHVYMFESEDPAVIWGGMHDHRHK